MHQPVSAEPRSAGTPLGRRQAASSTIAWGVLALGVLGVVGRILSYALNRDENLFVAVASQLGNGDIYRDLGYNHLPNLVYTFGAAFKLLGTDHYLLTARVVVILAWLLAIGSLWALSRQLASGRAAFFAVAFILIGNTVLLGEAGMLATNGFIPVALVFPATLCLFRGLEPDRPSIAHLAAAGFLASLAIGFKANFVFLAPVFAIATLVANPAMTVNQRIVRGLLPLAIGGLVGGLPTLLHFVADPQSVLAHTIGYFTNLQAAYWSSADLPKVMDVKGKILMAESIWLANTSLLALVLAGSLLAMAAIERWQSLLDWRIVMLCALALCGVVVAFVPSPSFPQYFVPPLPFLLILVLVLSGLIDPRQRTLALSLLASVAALALVNGAPRLGAGLAGLAAPGSWDALSLKREVAKAGAAAGLRKGDLVATLTPVMAIEGGYAIYPEFAAGQFVYRVAPFLSAEEEPFYRTTSSSRLPGFLDARPPDAILVNRNEAMAGDFATYAASRGYRASRHGQGTRAFDIYVRPR
ncbi:glycosyltransferase family 39 protein [Qipengyuania sp. 6B39]|uniref:glycosyltransferase family 39 protein n=1 Tax=Qipengyuania proteolytica TaxID=2867239 RepID=UPI001C8ADCAB|nr:glycosyltransferase family 39 protein [Qipengyuania proteolytica]MBX7495804.1 glycosyltransferase family 39 protein [Qipengyuania proteolytica]